MSKEKILVALNDTGLANSLVEELNKLDYSPNIVTVGGDVIARMKEFKPDLLVIDTVLPNKSGYDILNEKSFDRDITKIPVIVVSNSGNPIQMKQIPSTPIIKDYIIKSHIEVKEIIIKIEKVFGREIKQENMENTKTGVGSGKKVLWVEDDRLLSSILSKKFESTGHILLKANKADELFKILETETPDIIVLDLLLPETNGFEILQKVKMDEKFKNIPTIMLSNMSKQSDLDKAKMLGVNKFLVKAAVSLDEIIREVDLLLKSS